MFNPADINNVVSQWLAVPFAGLSACMTSIANGIHDFSQSVGDYFSGVTTFLVGKFGELGANISNFATSVGNYFAGVTALLIDKFIALGVSIVTLGTTLLAGLQAVFTIDNNAMVQPVAQVVALFNHKLPIVAQVLDLTSSGIADLFVPVKPDFKIPIPIWTYPMSISWSSTTYSIFDVDIIDKYMPLIRGLITGMYYIWGVQQVIKRMPGVLSGIGGL